jgi:hypothetical protein
MFTLEELNQRFVALVGMFQKDVPELQKAINKLALENGGLKVELTTLKQQVAQLAQQSGKVYPSGNPATIDGEVVVGRHPVTGQPITKAQLDKNPKLGLTMRFSEDDGG